MNARRSMPADPPAVEFASAINWHLLEKNEKLYRDLFSAVEPWQHVVIDDFLAPSIAAHASRSFPKADRDQARSALLFGTRKNDPEIALLDEAFSQIFTELHDARFVAYLERLSGIEGLRADETLFGAGIHQGTRGSVLRLHADHNTHPLDIGYRRVNVMLYLNENWLPQWNGALKLWDRSAESCRKEVEPLFNRCLIMAVDDTAFHEYGPLRVPETQTRNAVAAYYYARTPAPGQDSAPHITLWPSIRGEGPIRPFLHRLRRAAHAHLMKRVARRP